MNTEQLKTAEHILKENLKNIYFQQADNTFYDVISAMQIFASQESKKARIEENESMLEIAKLHGTERMVFVITERLRILKSI